MCSRDCPEGGPHGASKVAVLLVRRTHTLEDKKESRHTGGSKLQYEETLLRRRGAGELGSDSEPMSHTFTAVSRRRGPTGHPGTPPGSAAAVCAARPRRRRHSRALAGAARRRRRRRSKRACSSATCCLLVCRCELVRRPRRSRRGSEEQAYGVQSRVISGIISAKLEPEEQRPEVGRVRAAPRPIDGPA